MSDDYARLESPLAHHLKYLYQFVGTTQKDMTGKICDPAYCANRFDTGTLVTLIPTADEDSVFTSWGGHKNCPNSDTWMLVETRLCIAFFQKRHQLTVTTIGNGTIKFFKPHQLDCDNNTCTAWYGHGSVVLYAKPADGSRFIGWGGDCSGGYQWKQLALKEDKVCTATFE